MLHPLVVVGQGPELLTNGAPTEPAQQVHHYGPQEGEHRCAGSVGEAVGIRAELGVAGPESFVFRAPALANQSQQGFWSCARARGEEVPAAAGALPGVLVVMISTIQSLPGQFP